MWIDSSLEFADAVALDTTGTNTDNIGNNIDIGVARDIGQGQPLYFVVQVAVAPTSGGSATIQFSLVSDASSTIATNGSQTIHYLSDAIAIATLTAGWTMGIALPFGNTQLGEGGTGYERFLGFQTVTGTAALTAGSVNAFLTNSQYGWTAYPDGNN